MILVHANFDGIVGPTHNYAGLSHGNVASTSHGGAVSHPRAAVLQGLAKMKALADMGIVQGVIPPLERPNVGVLRRLGFAGSDAHIIESCAAADPVLLAVCSSVSSMWTANAATVVPSPDSPDGRVHFVPANLQSTLHRSLEHVDTARLLARIFPSPQFVHHPALPGNAQLGDEGAANHTRLATNDKNGVHLFVYGRRGLGSGEAPRRFPARQTLEASRAVARLTGLTDEQAFFVQQNPQAIDAGVFHNDVIAVGQGNFLLYHSLAFVDGPMLMAALRKRLGPTFITVEVTEGELSLADAVKTYLFNSQIAVLPDGSMCVIAPKECEEHPGARAVLDRILAEPNPVTKVRYFDLRESMRNGGGPACLRLRVPLLPRDVAEVHGGCIMSDPLYGALTAWATKHYRESLSPTDLADPALLRESRAALDELTHILRLGPMYSFQQ